ncbi:DUF2510 domain-containing protein [Mycobacterium sp. URHB0021]
MTTLPPGWYPDQAGSGGQRYFDGTPSTTDSSFWPSLRCSAR